MLSGYLTTLVPGGGSQPMGPTPTKPFQIPQRTFTSALA